MSPLDSTFAAPQHPGPPPSYPTQHCSPVIVSRSMRFSITTTIFAIISLTDAIDAFTSVVSRRPSWRLHSTEDKDRIKKAGQGITTQKPGDLCFYDPNENGRMQGSNTLSERLEKGASFMASGAPKTPPPPPIHQQPNASAGDPHTKTTPRPGPELIRRKISTANLTKLANGQSVPYDRFPDLDRSRG